MALGDLVSRTLKNIIEDVKDVLAWPIERGISWALERFLDLMEPDLIDKAKPMIQLILDNPDIPKEYKALLSQYTEKKSFAQAAALIPLIAGIMLGIIASTFRPALDKAMQYTNQLIRPALLRPQDAVVALYKGLLDEGILKDVLSREGFEDADITKMIDIYRTVPSIIQIRDAFLRGIIPDYELKSLLKKYGFTDRDQEIIKELYQLIPNTQDLILMAVREAFTPEIAKKFGQYEDFPPDFAKYAKQLGISQEWAERYWAAHWALPGIEQGYEMLHRAVIDFPTLQLLLRAKDVMPFWRDKLTEIAYTPFNRIDVRRMHKIGVLNEEQVKRAYLDLGYDDKKADMMTKFTIAYNKDPEQPEVTRSDERLARNLELTTSQLLDGYKNGLLTEAVTRSELDRIGYSPVEVDFNLAQTDYKKEKDRKDAYVSNIKSLYVTGVLDATETTDKLTAVGLTSPEIEQLIPVWQLERVRRVNRPSRSELDRFLKDGIIDTDTYRLEMYGLGYDDKYIDWYLQPAAKPEPAAKVTRPSRSELDRFLKDDIIDVAAYSTEMYDLGYTVKYINWYLQSAMKLP